MRAEGGSGCLKDWIIKPEDRPSACHRQGTRLHPPTAPFEAGPVPPRLKSKRRGSVYLSAWANGASGAVPRRERDNPEDELLGKVRMGIRSVMQPYIWLPTPPPKPPRPPSCRERRPLNGQPQVWQGVFDQHTFVNGHTGKHFTKLHEQAATLAPEQTSYQMGTHLTSKVEIIYYMYRACNAMDLPSMPSMNFSPSPQRYIQPHIAPLPPFTSPYFSSPSFYSSSRACPSSGAPRTSLSRPSMCPGT